MMPSMASDSSAETPDVDDLATAFAAFLHQAEPARRAP
jgi:hypothetical protein